MKTKLFKPELKLDFDDSIVSFVESYESNELLPELKVALLSDKAKSQYRSITVFGQEALDDLDEELEEWGLVNLLAGHPPVSPYVAIYGYEPEIESFDEDEII
ncbi:hypothetical protein NTH35_001763 [Vibrio fluvialis]|uniref:hypothetical protein n=1 Tax=Vibrio fluvialis TaxID=676 RepID=UPI001F21BCE9|nr:hypothetical protein [Vibrio fluvialis]EKO3430222.1 hypothetical protein [Vibrio fluvialis]EKO3513638.1 hypothetical protein [Vibrio fluvialis]EKO3957596.1 hypothetical protein [Vibrio fluvialis]ELV8762330.1 hypothetical protein [Vibrio fluvialis]MCE7659735.1 hypothetical protein [Vibrio fluvialis]